MKVVFRVVYLFVLISLVSCANVKKFAMVTDSKQLSEQEKFDFTYSFFEANKYQLKGNFDLAVELYSKCLAIDETSSAVNYNLSKIYLTKNEVVVASNYIDKAILYNSNNIEYLYLGGLVYQKNNEFEKGEICYNKLIKLDATNVEFYIGLADLYIQKGDFKSAIKTYDIIDEKFGRNEIISLQKNKIYVSLNKLEEARNELVLLAESNNNSPYFLRLIADFNVQFKFFPEAVIIYKQILDKNSDDGFAHIGLAECYQQLGKFDEAFNEIKLAFESNDVSSDIKIKLFITVWQSVQDKPELASMLYDLTKTLVTKYPDNVDVNTIYADFLLRDNKLEEAKEILEKIVLVRKDRYMLWEQLILIDNQFLAWEDCYNHSKEALKYFPNQSFLYFFKGFSAFQLEKFDESYKSFDFGFKIITAEDPLYNDYLSFLAEVNHKLGNSTEAYSYYDKLIENDSENIMALNNYSYYLSVDSLNLSKAKEMSYKTIEKEPNNATYLDTYAWILFRLNDFENALIYITKAYSNNTDSSAVIVEHYGDILYHNNRIEDAVKFWKEAQQIGNGTEFLDAKIEKKIYLD